MSTVIDELLDQAALDEAQVASFLEAHTFPVVEGNRVTFVYHGAADEVRLRHWIYGLPSSQPFERVAGTDLWFLQLELPEGSRMEYKIERVADGKREWLMDPLNPRVARDPFGANSVCHASGYETPEWTLPASESRPGRLETLRLTSQVFGRSQAVPVYLPARFNRRRRYPLLIVHDGQDYVRFASLRVVLDNLIERLEIPPMVVALTDSPDRLVEYGADPRHARFVVDELVPRLEARYPLVEHRRARGMLGASFGAVAALSTAWRHPGLFGRLLLQSGSFVFTDIGDNRHGPVFDPVVRFVNEFRDRPGRPSDRIFLSCGIYEALIYQNRSLVPLLQSTRMEVRYVEARDGHNWENWRDRLREGLSWLFPGPLWMVYE